jgi:hypothetical protein
VIFKALSLYKNKLKIFNTSNTSNASTIWEFNIEDCSEYKTGVTLARLIKNMG